MTIDPKVQKVRELTADTAMVSCISAVSRCLWIENTGAGAGAGAEAGAVIRPQASLANNPTRRRCNNTQQDPIRPNKKKTKKKRKK